MHTDEYEISLRRELDVCRAKIGHAVRVLSSLEAAHGITTDEVKERLAAGDLTGNSDIPRWMEAEAGLRAWERKEREYLELLNGLTDRIAGTKGTL